MRLPLSLALLLLPLTACDCDQDPPGQDDAGARLDGGDLPDVPPPLDEDAGQKDLDAGQDAGPPPPIDAGPPFFLDFDGGTIPGLECLPGAPPDLGGGVAGAIFEALDFDNYQGSSETGVVCGEVTCAEDVPCCVFCGLADCAVQTDAGATCPIFTQAIECDGNEECDQGVCCYSLSGTSCRPEAECVIDIEIPDFFRDAGPVPDSGPTPDAGPLPDAGPPVPVDAGPNFFEQILDQGLKVCRNSIFDCEVLSGEICCSSPRFVNVDLGLCLPALVCLGDDLP